MMMMMATGEDVRRLLDEDFVIVMRRMQSRRDSHLLLMIMSAFREDQAEILDNEWAGGGRARDFHSDPPTMRVNRTWMRRRVRRSC